MLVSFGKYICKFEILSVSCISWNISDIIDKLCIPHTLLFKLSTKAYFLKTFSLYIYLLIASQVEFSGEEGTGLGPTLEFYALVAAELQKTVLGLWLVDDVYVDEQEREVILFNLYRYPCRNFKMAILIRDLSSCIYFVFHMNIYIVYRIHSSPL